jgi:SAM-dependent methyltransferase
MARPVMNRRSLSPQLQRFVAEIPAERKPILTLMCQAARALPRGARVLDGGSGDAPYRELFSHCEYVTVDWPGSVYSAACEADIVASLEALPVPDQSFDAVLSTQVLEHVSDPAKVVSELFRVLTPGGHLWLTAPLVWPLHEEPFDFWRYTAHGLRHLLERAGFRVERLEPRGGYFGALATMMAGAPVWTGPVRRRDPVRRAVAFALRSLAPGVRRLDPLDGQRILTLGYTCVAFRPNGDGAARHGDG